MNISNSSRLFRQPLLRCLRNISPKCPDRLRSRALPSQARHVSTSGKPGRSPLKAINIHRLDAERTAYYRRRSYFAALGAFLSMGAIALIVSVSDILLEKNDAPPSDPLSRVERGTPVVQGVTGGTEVRKAGEGGAKSDEGGGVDQIPTGTSTIPTFPKTIELPDSAEAAVGGKIEYQLMGLGIRTVSFLGIQVYVVGLYVATQDVADLQQALVRKIDPIATTLIKTEKDRLRDLLLEPEQGEAIWADIIKNTGVRTAIRIVPTRNTDFQHLRDGWVRGVTARTQKASRAGDQEFEDDRFGQAMQDFKGIFSGGSRKNVPKGKTLILMRGSKGPLTVWYDDQAEGQRMEKMGDVRDERISRLIWMGYLAGKTVASEGARQSVVEGIMDYVERPVGTVATQVI
ncbi:MAG: Altered inheritance of mitochondria protein 18 mitochondrial [Caeruleum heppii]|nr:MAG: Altered inheritance of mitochondria protein 18 mitochondrial [Caeruleum heppii]